MTKRNIWLLVLASAALVCVVADHWLLLHAQPIDSCPDQALWQLVRPAMAVARKQKGQACVEVSEPEALAGVFCLEYHTMMPRGTRAGGR